MNLFDKFFFHLLYDDIIKSLFTFLAICLVFLVVAPVTSTTLVMVTLSEALRLMDALMEEIKDEATALVKEELVMPESVLAAEMVSLAWN